MSQSSNHDVMRRYLSIVTDILGQIAATQLDNIDAAAHICADSIINDGVVFCWGSGHSRISVEEMFPRIGSFPGFVPMVELATSNFHDILGVNGLAKTLYLERLEGFAPVILDSYEFHPADSMICYSNSGMNGMVVDMALGAKKRGMKVIGVTSLAHATGKARHSSGERLSTIADVVIDNCTPPGDAVIQIPGLKYAVSPTSTIASVAVTNTLKARTAEIMVERGVEPIVLTSPHYVTNPGETEAQMQRVYAEFRRRRR